MQIVTCRRPITIQLNVARVITLKEKDLLDVLAIPTDTNQLRIVLCDPILFTQVLWELTDQHGLTFDSFSALITPTDLESFAEAFTREVMDFFPKPIREVFQNALDQENQPPTTRGELSGDSPASSDSTPAVSPELSENSTKWFGDGNEPPGNDTPT